MKLQRLAGASSILVALLCGTAQAQDRPLSGFYGGVSLRDQGMTRNGMSIGIPANALSRFNLSAIDETASTRALLYGGYRFGNDMSVEASVNSSDPSSRGNDSFRRGIGLAPSTSSLGLGDLQSRSVNVDLFTSWNPYRSLSLYGRLGYAQTDLAPTLSSVPVSAGDPRRLRDGVNYGLGVRYDMTSALGLRLEYGRFGRYAGDAGSTPLESDQVTFGLQFRF